MVSLRINSRLKDFTNQKRGWAQSTDVTITYSSPDPSGYPLTSRQYQVTSNPNTPSSGWTDASSNTQTLTLGQEGLWYVHARATNDAGTTTERGGIYHIDTSGPKVNITPPERKTRISEGDMAQEIVEPIKVRVGITDYLQHFRNYVPGSGVNRYRYKWTQNPDWKPGSWGDTLMLNNSNRFSTELSMQNTQGVWYLFVQARDRVGNWSGIERGGPYYYLKIENGSPTFDGILDRRIRLVE